MRDPGKPLFGHPRGLTLLCLTGMWEVFALFGTRTVLVYYLSKQLLFSEADAVSLYALSSAASVVLSLVGAAIADRICGIRRAVVIGALLMAAGQFALVAEPLLYAGLLLLAAGDGLMKPPLVGQIGLLYADDDPRRERAFTLFKVGCNGGSLIAPIAFGIAAQAWGWSSAFVVGGVGMLLSVLTYWAGLRWLPPDPPRKALLDRAALEGVAKPSAWATLLIAWIGAAFFWTAYNQLGGTIAFWADHDMNRTLQLGESAFEIPATWFQSVNPLMILILAPIVTWLWRRHDTRASAALDVRKMALGTVFLATCFAVLAIGDSTSTGGTAHWIWLIIALVPLTLGELYLEPTGQALFTRLAPKHLSSIFVAVWMLSIMMGFVASGWFGAAWERMTPASYFALVAMTTLIGAAVFLLTRAFDRKTRDPVDRSEAMTMTASPPNHVGVSADACPPAGKIAAVAVAAPSAEQVAPRVVLRKDYRPFPFHIRHVALDIDLLSKEECIVRSRLRLERVAGTDASSPLLLDGTKFQLRAIAFEGRPIEASQLTIREGSLEVRDLPGAGTLEITTRIALTGDHGYMGIYREAGTVLADCEPTGFRHITYFPDRPDVKAPFEVRIEADEEQFPVLLSNGRRSAAGQLAGGRHFAVWSDPLPKSCYVFTMVAGRFARLDDEFVTMSGRRVSLAVHASESEIEQCREGLDVVKRSMRWEEQHYGREYDSDLFNVVVIPNYNQGGMEYRGLNIFTSANFRTGGTGIDDEAKMRADSTVGHEYFHNWTGNRVSCRDWFNLTVKEGFVVFKSQEFSAQLTDASIQRILDVRFLREYQFPEDDSASPQPPRPDSYIAVQNLYTRTTYEKGAEIVRMLRLILGPERFRAGSDLFYARHDLQAIEIEDMVHAFQDASGRDLSQFGRWYTQPGRPRLEVVDDYDAKAATYSLTLTQRAAQEQASSGPPLLIPVTLGLLTENGQELPLQLEGEPEAHGSSRTLELSARQATYKFINVSSKPTPSLLRNLSAPVTLCMARDYKSLTRLMLHDTDDLNRWDASQELVTRLILDSVAGRADVVDRRRYIEAIGVLLATDPAAAGITGLQLRRPAEATIALSMSPVEIDAVHEQRVALERELAVALLQPLRRAYDRCCSTSLERFTPSAIATRMLKNECLALLAQAGAPGVSQLCRKQLAESPYVTDQLGALRALLNADDAAADEALMEFYGRWRHDGPVIESWYSLQASTERLQTPSRLRKLVDGGFVRLDDAPGLRNVFDPFARNQIGFHCADGEGYRVVTDVALRLNDTNPRMAARFMLGFKSIRRVDARRQTLMREQLLRISGAQGLASELYEIAHECLR